MEVPSKHAALFPASSEGADGKVGRHSKRVHVFRPLRNNVIEECRQNVPGTGNQLYRRPGHIEAVMLPGRSKASSYTGGPCRGNQLHCHPEPKQAVGHADRAQANTASPSTCRHLQIQNKGTCPIQRATHTYRRAHRNSNASGSIGSNVHTYIRTCIHKHRHSCKHSG